MLMRRPALADKEVTGRDVFFLLRGFPGLPSPGSRALLGRRPCVSQTMVTMMIRDGGEGAGRLSGGGTTAWAWPPSHARQRTLTTQHG